MGVSEAKAAILNNRTALGIEFGSTRIKAMKTVYGPTVWRIYIKAFRAATRPWRTM